MADPTQLIRIQIGRWAALLALAAILPGCGDTAGEKAGDKPGAAESQLVEVDGSSTVFRISKAAQEEFAAIDDKIEVSVGNSGTGGGFTKYLANEIDIV